MIWVVGQHRGGAIDLFGHHQPYQHVRQGQRAERPFLVRGPQHVRRMALGPADQQRDVATQRAPVLQPLRELLGGVRLSRHFQRDDMRFVAVDCLAGRP